MHSSFFINPVIAAYLLVYLAFGVYTELRLLQDKPVPATLMEDFGLYERGLTRALHGGEPYSIQQAPTGFLYPPPALLIVESFSHIKPFFKKVAVFLAVNIALVTAVAYGVAWCYGYSVESVWYWFVLCLGFAPLFEMLHIGQINAVTLFGIFVCFLWEKKAPVLAGLGLALAIVTKLTPVLLLGYLLANRSYRALAATLLAVAAMIAMSIWRYGPAPAMAYPGVLEGLLNQHPLGSNVQSLVAKLAIADAPWFRASVRGLPAMSQASVQGMFGFFSAQYEVIQTTLTFYVIAAIILSGWFTFRAALPREPLFVITMLGMTLVPNVMWYHHYVFLLLPLLVWMGWSHCRMPIVVWCLLGLLLVQLDRWFAPYGLAIHAFGHASLVLVLLWQARRYFTWMKYAALPAAGVSAAG